MLKWRISNIIRIKTFILELIFLKYENYCKKTMTVLCFQWKKKFYDILEIKKKRASPVRNNPYPVKTHFLFLIIQASGFIVKHF